MVTSSIEGKDLKCKKTKEKMLYFNISRNLTFILKIKKVHYALIQSIHVFILNVQSLSKMIEVV